MKKFYETPFAEILSFECEDVLGDSDVVITPGQGVGDGGKDDETEFLPNVNGFN